jgi:DNA polymerase-3 subunit chi
MGARLGQCAVLFRTLPAQQGGGLIMRVDFYQLTRDPVQTAAAMLARKTIEAGQRLVISAQDQALLEELSRALWENAPDAFLANGIAGGPHDARQPILLAQDTVAANGAAFLLLADGQWREPDTGCQRVLYLFDQERLQDARQCWSQLGRRDGIDRHYWRQDERGRWVEGP